MMFDKIWHAIGGRKFLAFVAATALCWFGKISGDVWVVAMGLFVSANVMQKILVGRGGGSDAGKTS